MFHSFSAAEPFGEKEEKSIKKCDLHFISLLLFFFLDAFSNLGEGGGEEWKSSKRIWGLLFGFLYQSPSQVPHFHSFIFKVRSDLLLNTYIYLWLAPGLKPELLMHDLSVVYALISMVVPRLQDSSTRSAWALVYPSSWLPDNYPNKFHLVRCLAPIWLIAVSPKCKFHE